MAVKLIFQHLPIAYEKGSTLLSRNALALASYYAGLSINVARVGNVHALSHQLGGCYGTPHGLANAILLPAVLDHTLKHSDAQLARLGRLLNSSNGEDMTHRQCATSVVVVVRKLNQRLGIPTHFTSLKVDDIAHLASCAAAESVLYPVPFLMRKTVAAGILEEILSAAEN